MLVSSVAIPGLLDGAMRIYYINLDRRPDRRAFMEQQFARLGLAAERVPSVTPAEISNELKDRYCNAARLTWQTPSELACSLSHLKALDALLASDEELALVLEDDTILSPVLADFLRSYEREAREDVLRIESSPAQQVLCLPGDRQIEGVSIGRYFNRVWGAGAYIVNRRAARALTTRGRLLTRPADRVVSDSSQVKAHGLSMRQADPGLCIQAIFVDGIATSVAGSDLMPARSRRRDEEARYPAARWARIYLEEFRSRFVTGPRHLWHQVVDGARWRNVPFKSD